MSVVTFLIDHPRVVTMINVLIMVSSISGVGFLPVQRSGRGH
jgi:hypothetical protein